MGLPQDAREQSLPEHGHVLYGDKFYRQKDGTAMGCPTSMIIADIVMASVDKKAILIEGIKIWGRYIDDVFAVIRKENLDGIMVMLNNLERGIEFTVETEREGFLSFLDVGLTRKEDGSILTSVFRKPTDCGIHLNFNSNNPMIHKRQVIKSLVQRAKQEHTQELTTEEIQELQSQQHTEVMMVETRSGKMQDPAQERIIAEESAKPLTGATIGRDASSDPVVLNPNIDIPKYDGTEDPRPWIESLEEIGFLYHWADYIISRYAAMNMIGSAKTWLNLHKISFTSWENFKSRLIEDFASDANKEEMKMRLNRMQQWNEPAIRFAEDILVLCNKVDPQMEEQTKLNWVIGGLKKEYSFALHLNPPKNINELLEICKKLDLFEKNYQERVEKSKTLYNGPRSPRPHHQEQWKSASSFRRPYQNTSKPQAPAPRYFQNTSKPQAPTPRYYQNLPLPQVSAPRRSYTPNPEPKPVYPNKTYNKNPNSNRNRTEDGRPICFKCNKPGHVARYCRVRFVRIVEEDPIVTQDKVEEEIRMDNGTEKSRPLLYADVKAEDGEYIIEENHKMFQTNGLRLARSLINVVNKETYIWITNPYPRPLKILKNQTLCFGSQPAEMNLMEESEQKEHEEPQFQINENLAYKEKEQLKQVLEKYEDLFSSGLGRSNLAKHRIDTEGAKPIKHKPYRVSAKEREIIKEQIDEMLRDGIIRPSSSPWSFPVILVKKRDGHFDPNAITYIHTDASNIGLGATLVQKFGDKEKLISYLSQTLSKPEQNYSTTEKECLAVVWSMAKLRPYLYGRHFKIVTDHHALCWLKNLKDPTGRLARWALKIQEYDFDIIHKSGKKHLDADGLSRGPLPETDWDEDFERLFLNQITDEEDKFIESVKKNLNGSRRSIAQNFKEEDGCLFKKNPNPEGRAWLLVVPEKKKREIMKEYHNHMSNGHLGVARTMYRIKSKYFWPSMLKDVSEFVKTCHLCQSRKGSNQLPSGLLQPIPPANFPFERIGIDFVGPLPSTKNRKKWIIVLTDYYTRYAETRAVSEATVKVVSKFLVEDIFFRHGAPQYLISERGSQFTSNLMKEVMKTCKIKHCFTTSYHPQTNGLTERLNRTLINMLSMYVNTVQKNWDEILPFITHAYNTTIQETTGYSPFFLMFGREPTSLLDDRNISVDIDKDDYDEYIKHHLDKINRTRKLVINNTIKTQERMKKNYDKKHMERSYEPGELVAVWTPIRKIGKCEKLLRKYFGPYKILKKLSNVVGALENSLPNKQIVEALTAGVTYDLKKMIYTRNPQTPEEWLDYVNTIQKRPVTRGQPTPQRGLDRWQPESTPPPSQGLYTLKKLKTRIDFNRNVVSQQGTNIPATLFYFETDLAYVNDAYNVINPDRKYNINQHLHIVNTQILDNHCAPSGSNPLYVNHLQQTLSTQSSIPGENKLTSDLIDKYHKINSLLDLKLIRLLKEFAEIFPTDPFKVPTLHIQPVQIKPNTDRVIRLRPYRIPFTYRKEIDIQINEMLKNNIIEPAIGEYASPITLVKKKNGTFRMCVDFRKLNEHIPVDPQPIPLIESVIEKLSKAKYFSSLDLSNAYWTVPIHPDSRPYLAFTTHAGVYMFKRLPFGLRSSPQIFERAIGQILRKYNFQFLEHYYDDFIIFSDSFEEHLEHLRLFFQLCRAENIRLNLNKCQLCKTSTSFLGYEITQGTYKPHLTNTQVIGTIQPPTNVKTLQSFLGVVNVYHKFIPHYAQLRSPLNILLKKNIPFKWTLECQKAFEDLKSSLTASPVLHIFKEDLPCFLYCDASTLGISGILKQKDENGEEHPVQYFSRSLRKYEQNYSISELECLAIIESIEYFRVYLLGRHFTIYSDHQALVYLKNIKNPSGRLFRWSLRLSPYTFDIHYLKGKKQLEADLLSRQPFCGFLEAQQLEEHQHRVPEKYQSLINTHGLAIITKKGVPRVVVPDTLRNKLLQKAHEWYNHPGITQLTRLITSQYYWDGMTKDINNYVRKCKICQIIKPPKGPSYGEMGTLPLAKEPYELMSMDTVAGFTKYGGNRAYLHVICDHMSRYCWTFPSKSTSTLTYIQILKRVFQEGIPKNLLTDRAPAFTSAQFRRFLISQGIKPLYTTANHPQSNGLSERLNATITGKLKILHLEHPKQTWTKQIERVTRIYNLTPHTVTGFPPIYLLKGIVPNNLNNHVQTFPELSEARRIALQKTQARHKAEKLMYAQKHKKIDFVPGDLVLVKVYRHPNTPKLEPNYTGPYEILEILSPQVVRINRPNRPLQLQTEIINIEKLRRYVENSPHITPPTDLPDSPPRQNYFLFPYRHFTTDILGDPGSSRPRKWFQPFNHLDNSIFTDEKFYKPDFPITSKPTFSSIVKPTKSSTLVLDPKINPFDNMVERQTNTKRKKNIHAKRKTSTYLPRCQTIAEGSLGEDRVISRHFIHQWPPRGPDLTPCDFCLWEYIESRVYRCQPNTLAMLKTYIRQHISSISTDMLFDAVKSVIYRLQAVFENEGRHIERGFETKMASSSQALALNVEKLTGSNYRSWKFNMKMLLIERGLWECVINGETIDADEDQRKYEKTKIKQEKALATIALSISTEQQIHVIDCKTASEAWTTLEQIFEPKSRARILQLKKQFVNIKFIEEENMVNYLSRLKTCSDHLREAGCEVKDEDLAYSMIAGLPDSYDGIIMNFGNMTADEFTSSKVRQVLLTEHERRTTRKEDSSKEVLQLNKHQNNSSTDSRRKCYRCGKIGHIATNCRGMKQTTTRNRDTQHYQRKVNKSDNFLAALNLKSDEDSWLLDSGATNHVCRNKDWFVDLREVSSDPIMTASGTTEAKGYGHIFLQTSIHNESIEIKLNNVLYVPNVRRNLLSVSKIEENGNRVTFRNMVARVFDPGNRIIAEATNVNGLYIVKGKTLNSNVTVPQSFQEAVQSPEAVYWRKAMEDELRVLQERGTWELSTLPPGKKPISRRWVYK
ncbi:K02A2.6-like, partial [Cordylochernes scorpioides]